MCCMRRSRRHRRRVTASMEHRAPSILEPEVEHRPEFEKGSVLCAHAHLYHYFYKEIIWNADSSTPSRPRGGLRPFWTPSLRCSTAGWHDRYGKGSTGRSRFSLDFIWSRSSLRDWPVARRQIGSPVAATCTSGSSARSEESPTVPSALRGSAVLWSCPRRRFVVPTS